MRMYASNFPQMYHKLYIQYLFLIYCDTVDWNTDIISVIFLELLSKLQRHDNLI